jgi:predicted permease
LWASPIFELLYGKAGLEMGIVMSLGGSILICVTLGVVVGSWYGEARPSWRTMGANVLRFPPFLALCWRWEPMPRATSTRRWYAACWSG